MDNLKKLFFLVLLLGMTAVPVSRAAQDDLFGNGGFFIGCNYWARHAGMFMWRDWNPQMVERELAELAKYQVSVLRVFPLWPDFQPLTGVYGGGGAHREYFQNNRPLSNPAGVDEEMMKRFRFFCDTARKNNNRLIVGLITGWMSGRHFVPPAFERSNVLTDPDAVMWEVRFVRHFVQEMKDHEAIAAWDLGNECNVMGKATQGEFWRWMFEISAAIRLEDSSRPIVSGMHGLTTEASHPWNIRLNGELMDVLTTHPYPLYTPGCSKEPFNTMRNELHPTAETLLYANLAERPGFIEEVGNLGPTVASAERTAGNVRCSLFSAWANDLKGYLWWCNSDQENLRFPPYDWTANERELGLIRSDWTPKPVMLVMRDFQQFRQSLPFAKLPPRRVDAVCVVSERESAWFNAFGAFLLSRQAGFDIAFAGAEHPLPNSDFYILTAGTTDDSYTHTAWLNLLQRVSDGATLLVSKSAQTRLTGFLEATGNEIDFMHLGNKTRAFTLADYPDRLITTDDEANSEFIPRTSTVLGKERNGVSAMTVKAYGKGRIVVVNAPVERSAVFRGDTLTGKTLNPIYLVYREAAKQAGVKRRVQKEDSPGVGLTEHRLPNGETVVIAINYEPDPVVCPVRIDGTIGRVWRGKADQHAITIPANDAALLTVK